MGAPTVLELARSIDRKLAGNINFPFRALSAVAEAISDNDFFLAIDATLNAVTATLPSAATVKAGLSYWLVRTDSVLANAVTIATTGGETINGSPSAAISLQYGSLQIVSDGSNWLLFASPDAFKLQSDILWIFPNTLSVDQNAGLYTYYAATAIALVGFDLTVNAAPSGQSIIIDWKVNGVIDATLRTTLVAGDDYVELLVPVALGVGDTLQPVVTQVGAPSTGQTLVMRARGR